MSFVQSQILTELTCTNCKKYLSYFPIYQYLGQGSVCGRCPKPNGDNVVRNQLYECLAETQKFPCCYSSDGCTENLIPDKIPRHEKYCIFRKLDCPLKLFVKCEWQGFGKDLLDHFEQKHPMFILKETQFELDFINSHKETYLLPYGEDLFIVNRMNDSKANIFTISLNYVGNNVHAENYLYKVILESGTRSHEHVLTNKMKDKTVINGEFIRSVLKDPYSVLARIEVIEDDQISVQDEKEEEYNEAVNYDLLRELECFVCMDYMLPPIHQCLTGHSICLKCKSKLTQCPNCQKEFQNTQNFVLAQVINYVTYPCKHSKCRFTGNPFEVKKHENSCIYGPFKCPLNEYEECNVEVPFKEINDHLINSHYENLLEMDTVNLPFELDEYQLDEDCYILKYNFKLFNLHYLYRDNRFHWTMQLIGPAEESDKYKFEIDIIDNSGNNNRALFRSSCSPLSDKATAFEESKPYIYIDYDQIKPMITNELSYRVRILRD